MSVTRREMLAAVAIASATSGARLSAATSNGMLLVDPSLPAEARRIAERRDHANRVTVEADLVRQWRDGLENRIVSAGGALALVRWDKALILCGLARESGLRARQERLGRATVLVTIDKSASA
jgi:hypothetical protein